MISTTKSSKTLYLRTKKDSEMSSSLCPHVFKEYSVKVSEILETYKPQILNLVKFQHISTSLLSYNVIKQSEHDKIMKITEESQQIEMLLQIIAKRMWGLENFITVLIDRNLDNWLAEELFQAYVRHLVANMKKIQAQNICSCFQTGGNSRVHRTWIRALETFDNYLNEIGKSLGFLTLTMYPVSSALNFITDKLPLPRKKIIRLTQCDEALDSDSEEDKDDNEHEDEVKIATHTSNSCTTTDEPVVGVIGQKLSSAKHQSKPAAADLITNAELSEKIMCTLNCKSTSEVVPDSTSINYDLSQETFVVSDEELEWDEPFSNPLTNNVGMAEETTVNVLKELDEIYYATLSNNFSTQQGSEDKKANVKPIHFSPSDMNSNNNGAESASSAMSIYQSCSSLTDLEICRTLTNLKNNEQTSTDVTNEIASLVDKFDLISTCTPRNPKLPSPTQEVTRRHSAFGSTSSFEFEPSRQTTSKSSSRPLSLVTPTKTATSSMYKSPTSPLAKKPTIKTPVPRSPTLKKERLEAMGLKALPKPIAKEHSAKATNSIKSPTSPINACPTPPSSASRVPPRPPLTKSKSVTSPQRKPLSLRTSSTEKPPSVLSKDTNSTSIGKTTKVAAITPRQRVLEEIRTKKANAPPPPPVVNEKRLSPEAPLANRRPVAENNKRPLL